MSQNIEIGLLLLAEQLNRHQNYAEQGKHNGEDKQKR